MFNIFQYEKINNDRLNTKKLEEKILKYQKIRSIKINHLSTQANLRRLE